MLREGGNILDIATAVLQPLKLCSCVCQPASCPVTYDRPLSDSQLVHSWAYHGRTANRLQWPVHGC